MNVGFLNGAKTAQQTTGSDEAAVDRSRKHDKMALDAAMALLAARRNVAEMSLPPATHSAAPTLRKS
jgi:hypothetical protein